MSLQQTSIPGVIMRGGTSRGAYFLARDLPQDTAIRDAVLLRIMGGPDALQVDGIGGGHALTNKVAVVSTSGRDDADVEYRFLQVVPSQGRVTDVQNCGNILAGVGPFAIESGLVNPSADSTPVRVHMLNSDSIAELTVPTPGGKVAYASDVSIDGVPGRAAGIVCDFLDVAGSTCGALLPTGNARDEIDGITVTCIDNGMPVVVLRAEHLGVTGRESPEQLDQNDELKDRLEMIRLKAGERMSLGDVAGKTVPKMCLVSSAAHGGIINTRTFIPHNCHRSIGVLGAVTVATACLLPGSVAQEISDVPDSTEMVVDVEHPAGALTVRLVASGESPHISISRAGVIRTARLIMKGDVFVPSDVWDGSD